jgi:hypothetical protein
MAQTNPVFYRTVQVDGLSILQGGWSERCSGAAAAARTAFLVADV